ncbi:hypothetical protein K439DRAFT_613944 [Ramaria rubella]|nr:hypothetical protein K439DRAFT_613944 [Ramaria rubella]
MTTIPQLPNEVIEEILVRLPPLTHSKESVRTLCRVGLANSRFLAVSRLSHIWEPHFAARWMRADIARQETRVSTAQGDWWYLYSTRSRIDRKALDLLHAIIIAQPDTRRPLAVELAHDLGYDAWDAISEATTHVQCQEVVELSETFSIPTQGLTRQYWAREVLGVISRVRAVNIWLRLSNNQINQDVSFEEALAALSSFFGEDIDKIFEEFDRLAVECHAHLVNLGVLECADPTERIVQICAWMRQQGFVKADLINYHNLLNHFPHRVLFEQPVTLPISLVYVFVCISRRLGLDARPVAFPHKVLAVVIPAAGPAVYVDVFESATRPILSYTSDLPFLLQGMGIGPHALAQYSAPAPASTMLLRAVGNIIHSLERIMILSEGDQTVAHYAAYCAALLLTGDPRLIQTLFVMGVGGPLDNEVVLKHTLRPGLSAAARDVLDEHLLRAENNKSSPKITGRRHVMYFTGMVFHHKMYDYVGLTKDWDYSCEASEEWMFRMGIDSLSRGRHQPFYRCFTPDGRIRYVAEENIDPLHRPTLSVLHALIVSNKELGRWFDGVELTALGNVRFILSAEASMLYPDDDAEGRAFLAQDFAASSE